jgi:hypothetical protein
MNSAGEPYIEPRCIRRLKNWRVKMLDFNDRKIRFVTVAREDKARQKCNLSAWTMPVGFSGSFSGSRRKADNNRKE